ncbi:MAG: DNA adenine methylase [Planctomycetaceae bacterium]|jgi:adenine-specific DNA-methyltransferase|nr:DNA adenine methylase [Planctomycetaceae bacterium]
MDFQTVLFESGKWRTKPVKPHFHTVVPRSHAGGSLPENEDYLTKQILTCIGNKRSLLQFITKGINIVRKKLGKDKLDIFDVFSGSGVVARFFKQYADNLFVNDLEKYSTMTNECYLANTSDINIAELQNVYQCLISTINTNPLQEGFITELYSPKDDDHIQAGERVFYTRRNAMYIDTMRQLLDSVDFPLQKFFLAPLLSEASVHSNTSGTFKGFHKNKATGIGQFGGSNSDALLRIKGEIHLPFPVFSRFHCHSVIYNGDSNEVIKTAPEADLAYLDPPYNQHPYGSNYFMLNLILVNKRPTALSKVSGIAEGWNRSVYNKKQFAAQALKELAENIKAKFVLISFNSEGFITLDVMKSMLQKIGKVEVLETNYNTFRGCRNLEKRDVYVREYLYLLEK